MTRIAIFPGSFDPITKGHENILRRINTPKTLEELKEQLAMLENKDNRIVMKSSEEIEKEFIIEKKKSFFTKFWEYLKS